ncbi:AAA domain-containing protein [Nocardia sp. NPDC050193]
MFVVGDRVVYGAADLVRAARCEFALLRALDAELGTVGPLPGGDSGCAPAGHARDVHEVPAFDRVLGDIRQRYGGALVEIPRPGASSDTFAALSTAHTETLAALDAGAPAVRNPLVFDGEMFARAELLTRTADGIRLHGVDTDGSGPVATALRITVAAALFDHLSVRVDPRLSVHSEIETHHVGLSETRPVYSARRQRITEILSEHSSELLPVQWGDPRFRACHRCTVCRAARVEARDLLLVAGMDLRTRAALRAAGITTVDRLTTRTVAAPEIPPRLLARLRAQAVVQLRQEHSGRGEYVTADPSALDMLPAATPGDLALHVDETAPGRLRIEVAARDTVRLTREIPLESPGVTLARRHEVRAAGRRAFTDILAALTEPLLADPELHIYHYTAAARTFLSHTGARLGFGEETVDVLLRAGTLVDLYPIFRGAFVAGSQTYALPAVAAVLGGTPGGSGAGTVLWLADRLRAQMGDPPTGHVQTLDRLLRETPAAQPSSTEAALAEFAARRPGMEAEDPAEPHRVAALTAALLGYHRREQQTAWWAHIDRLTHPPADWPAEPGVMMADSAAVDTKWHIGPGDTVRRFLRLTGRLAGPGLAPGTTVCVVYEPAGRAPRAVRTCGTATVLGCAVDTDFADTVRLEETLASGAEPHDELPVALAPALPDPPVAAADAIEDIGRQLLVSLPAIPAAPLFDLLTRRPPRLTTAPDSAGPQLPPAGDDPRAAITAALRELDRSYLAVQAPTGTGRTAVLADVLAALVTGDNWRIGIVAPTAAPVENLLDAVVRAGVLPELVAKSDSVAVAPEWLIFEADRYPRFLANAIRGCVVGGTPADFTDPLRIPRDSLDLLVIADANAFPLAITAAVSVSARNLLLTGDPAARYEPDPGPHPEPVHTPALTWPSYGHVTLPATHGYFLGRTRRLHPRLSEALSSLYFDGRLRACPPPAESFADAVEPGIATVAVEHHGNSTASDAEAREVLHQIRNLLGQRWDDGTGPRLLQPHDIVVVSPYRAQVGRIRSLLARARFEEVLVGTPDLLRGREAAVVLLSLAASSPEDSPIPVGALLSPALVHDAVGRARRRAVIVRSPLLTEFLPETPGELANISRFLRLDNR